MKLVKKAIPPVPYVDVQNTPIGLYVLRGTIYMGLTPYSIEPVEFKVVLVPEEYETHGNGD
jgi:hypothetical protein